MSSNAVRPKLPHAVFGYVAHGAETEATLRANRAAFDAWRLVTRVLVGVSKRHQAVNCLVVAMPHRSASPRYGAAPWSHMKATR